MNEQKATWTFSDKDIFTSLGFDPSDLRVLDHKANDFIKAILELEPDWTSESSGGGKVSSSSTAPLLLPGTVYHLNLTATARLVLENSVRIVGLAFILQQVNLLTLSVSLSSAGIHGLIRQTTKLNDRQRSIIKTIYDLKRAKPFPPYWPTSEEIGESLQIDPAEVHAQLTLLTNKVVRFDADKKHWRVLW